MIKFACSVMWVIVYHDISILSTAFVHIHENEWTSSLMVFLKSCVYIKGMFHPEINQLMFIIHTCSVLLFFFLFLVTSRRFDLILFFAYLILVYLLINLVRCHPPLLMKSTKWRSWESGVILGKPFLAIQEGLKLKFPPGSSTPTMVGPPTSLT